MSTALSSLNGLKDYFDVSKHMQKLKDLDVRIVLLVSRTAPLFVIDALKAAFLPETGSGKLHIEAITEQSAEKVAPKADVCIIVDGDDLALSLSVAKRWQNAHVPTCLLCQSQENADIAHTLSYDLSTMVAETQLQVQRKLAAFMVDVLSTEKAISAAFCFTFIRPALVLNLSQRVAITNAAIGAVDIIPGADFPAMFLSESTLLAQVGALYGQEQSLFRLFDFAGVLAWALASRGLTKQLETYLPFPRQLIRGGVALGSSYALGHVIALRYAASETIEKKLRGMAHILSRGLNHITALFGEVGKQVVSLGEGITYQVESEEEVVVSF